MPDLANLDWTDAATIVTVVGALGALWYTAKTDRRAVDDKRREQASKVAAWALTTTYRSAIGANPHVEPFEAIVHNGSDQPVHQVRLDLLPLDWKKSSKPVDSSAIVIVRPNSETPSIPMPRLEGTLKLVDGMPAPPPLRLYFRDNAGIRWVRHPDGKLKVDSRRPPKAE